MLGRYVGLGYNVIKGNPSANHADPGFARAPIFELQFNDSRRLYVDGVLGVRISEWCRHRHACLWRVHDSHDLAARYDNKYAIPDGMTVRAAPSCSYSSQVHECTSASEYQKSLRNQVTVSAGASWYVSVEFSASHGYQSFVKDNTQQSSVQILATAECSVYVANLQQLAWVPTFTEEFRAGVRGLGAGVDYSTFVNMFGTHYVLEATMGGSSTYIATMSRQSLASLQQSGVDVSTAAELGFYAYIGANVSSSSSQQGYKAFSQRVSQQSLAGIPMPAPACGGELCSDYTAWEQAVDANPMPIRITLASIVKLLVPKYFPSDHNITAKATQLAAFLATGYCGDVPSCGPAPPAPPLACASSCPTSRCNTTTGLCASCPTKVENEDCSGHGTCSHLSGACTCDSGFAGPSCACATSFKIDGPVSEYHGDGVQLDECCEVVGIW